MEIKKTTKPKYTAEQMEWAARNIQENNYGYGLHLETLYVLRSLVNDKVRNAVDKKKAFYQAMLQHDDSVYFNKMENKLIITGGCPLYEYLKVLRFVKSKGGTEFDEYWSEILN